MELCIHIILLETCVLGRKCWSYLFTKITAKSEKFKSSRTKSLYFEIHKEGGYIKC